MIIFVDSTTCTSICEETSPLSLTMSVSVSSTSRSVAFVYACMHVQGHNVKVPKVYIYNVKVARDSINTFLNMHTVTGISHIP